LAKDVSFDIIVGKEAKVIISLNFQLLLVSKTYKYLLP